MDLLARRAAVHGDQQEAAELREHARKWPARWDRTHRKQLRGEKLTYKDFELR